MAKEATINRKGSVLVLTYWSFNDALIQTYTLPYVSMIARNLPEGKAVFLVTLDKNPAQPVFTPGENIRHLSIPYHPFGIHGLFMWLKTFIKLLRLIRKENIGTIHAWCTPAGMIGYILSRISGKQLIIDSYEPHAEAMVENGSWKRNGIAFRILYQFEKWQTRRATFLIAATEGMKTYAGEKYGHVKDNYFVKPACVDLDLFSLSRKFNPSLMQLYDLQDKITCVYAGKFGGIYLRKEVFDFFKVAQDFWGDKFRIVLLTSHSDKELNDLAISSGLNTSAMIRVFVPHHEIPDYIGLGSFALTPVKPVPTKRYCTPIKNGEYWALGLPIISTANISDDSDIILQNGIGSIWDDLSITSYLKSVQEMDVLLRQYTSDELSSKIRPVAEHYRNFKNAQTIYSTIYGT